MAYEILLIGLGQVGASIGLALTRTEGDFIRIGYDPDKDTAKQAEAVGAIDRLVSHPRRAFKSADLIIFSLPYHEVEVYLENLGINMKADAVIVDTAAIKSPFFEWAKKYLPAESNVIGVTPIVGALEPQETGEGVDADRFAGGLLAITALPDTPERAMTLAINLANLLDADPLFLDVTEHDSATASIEDLPLLMSAALFQSTANSASWRELQRLAGSSFMLSTELCSAAPKQLQRRLAVNRELILPRLDLVISEIERMRDLLANEENDALLQYLEDADTTRYAWLRARERGDWASKELRPEGRLEGPGFLQTLFGGLADRKPKED